MKNDLTRLLGIEYPIVQGGMLQIAGARLVAAVSAAGGLGTLGMRPDLENWRAEIKKIKELTQKPFAVNLPLHAGEMDRRLEIIAAERVPVVVTAAGNPAGLMPRLREAGAKVLHVVAAVKQAEKVAAAGVDAVVAEGGESGGLVAKDRVSTLVLVPMVVDRVKVPVIAAGGIGDARGLAAAFALGAQGVQLGTVFIPTLECEAGDDWKQAILRATETDTEVVPRGQVQGRVLKKSIHPAGYMAGQISGALTEIKTVEQVIKDLVAGVRPALEQASKQLG